MFCLFPLNAFFVDFFVHFFLSFHFVGFGFLLVYIFFGVFLLLFVCVLGGWFDAGSSRVKSKLMYSHDVCVCVHACIHALMWFVCVYICVCLRVCHHISYFIHSCVGVFLFYI